MVLQNEEAMLYMACSDSLFMIFNWFLKKTNQWSFHSYNKKECVWTDNTRWMVTDYNSSLCAQVRLQVTPEVGLSRVQKSLHVYTKCHKQNDFV